MRKGLLLIMFLFNGCALDFDKFNSSTSNNTTNTNAVSSSFWNTGEGWQPVNSKTFSDKKVVQ